MAETEDMTDDAWNEVLGPVARNMGHMLQMWTERGKPIAAAAFIVCKTEFADSVFAAFYKKAEVGQSPSCEGLQVTMVERKDLTHLIQDDDVAEALAETQTPVVYIPGEGQAYFITYVEVVPTKDLN